MQTQTITVPVRHILAAAPHAAKQDIRYYLNGLLIEVRGGKVFVVATQGHSMAALIGGEALDKDGKPGDDCQIIIPAHALKRIKVTKKSRAVDVCIVREGRTWRINGIDFDSIVFDPIDGEFPDWRSVVPRCDEDGIAQFAPRLLALFSDSAKALDPDSTSYMPTLRHAGAERSALVGLHKHPQFIGVVMPVRGPHDTVARPEWATHDEPAPAKKASSVVKIGTKAAA